MIDDLRGDAATFGFLERPVGVAVESVPGLRGRFWPCGGFQCAVGIVGEQEGGMADENALLVVVGIDEPAGDAVGLVDHDLASLWL